MRIGQYEVHAIDAGRFALDGGAMFGVVPRPLWERTNPPDSRNRIAMATRCLLVIGHGRKILVDTGNGAKFSGKLVDIYRMEHIPVTFDHALSRFGLSSSDITDVVLTHLHFDHAGGSTVMTSEGLRPAFVNARYYVQRDQWKAALHPTERDKASFFEDDYLPLERAGVIEQLDGEGELFPGFSLRLFHGHTTALQSPVIQGDGTTAFFCADLVPLAAHLQLPWIMGYDLRPLITLEEKRKTLDRAAEEHWNLILEHDPLIEAVTVKHGAKGIERAEEVHLDGPHDD